MFQDSYIKLNKKETTALLEATKSLFDGVAFQVDHTIVMARDLSFYAGYRFLDIADHAHIPPARRFLIEKDEKYTVIDFTNAPLYALNASVPIKINKETLADYTRFFFQFVRGRHGRFLIVESVDDIQWREEPPPAARRAIGKLITPMTLMLNDTPNGPYHLLAQMIFKDSLFQSDITVTDTGMVSLSNEKLMVEDLPVLDDVFGQ